jgi:hypothetical protein
MPQAVGSIASVEHIEERLLALERRVSILEVQQKEQRELNSNIGPGALPASPVPSQPIAFWAGSASEFRLGEFVPTLGKAILGIAGAYLLRAIAESGPLPKLVALSVGIVYAAMWMIWAAKTHATSRFGSATYAITSALILSPMLWESTVRFQVLSPAASALILAGFAVLTLALAWKRELQMISWIAILAAVVTSWALIIATHELVTLTIALLSFALVTEVATIRAQHQSVRVLPALAADFSVWLLVAVMTSSDGVPEAYRPAAPATIALLCFALMFIYGGSIGIRSFGFLRRISLLESIQVVVALSLGSFGIVRAGEVRAGQVLGLIFFFISGICYWGALWRFGERQHARNRHVCATGAAACVVAGSFFLFPADLRVLFLCLGAMTAAFAYRRMGRVSLGFHTCLFLAVATGFSSVPIYVVNALTGTVPTVPHWDMWPVIATAVLCYILASPLTETQSEFRQLWVVPPIIVGFTAASLAVVGIVWLAAGHLELSAPRLSVIRTIVNCSLALVLAFSGYRSKRIEFVWIAYTAVAFGTLKLLFEDLRFGNAASLVVSFLFYGLILILLPRFTRRTQFSSKL